MADKKESEETLNRFKKQRKKSFVTPPVIVSPLLLTQCAISSSLSVVVQTGKKPDSEKKGGDWRLKSLKKGVDENKMFQKKKSFCNLTDKEQNRCVTEKTRKVVTRCADPEQLKQQSINNYFLENEDVAATVYGLLDKIKIKVQNMLLVDEANYDKIKGAMSDERIASSQSSQIRFLLTYKLWMTANIDITFSLQITCIKVRILPVEAVDIGLFRNRPINGCLMKVS